LVGGCPPSILRISCRFIEAFLCLFLAFGALLLGEYLADPGVERLVVHRLVELFLVDLAAGTLGLDQQRHRRDFGAFRAVDQQLFDRID